MSMPESEARKKWGKENTAVFTIKLNRNTDADIIRKLLDEPTRQGYIKTLIRQDLGGTKSGIEME